MIPTDKKQSEWNYDEEDSCCTRLQKKVVKYTGVNTMEIVKEYQIVVDKANKDFDKFWEKCITENFNLLILMLLLEILPKISIGFLPVYGFIVF